MARKVVVETSAPPGCDAMPRVDARSEKALLAPACTYTWRNCFSRTLRLTFPCLNAPSSMKAPTAEKTCFSSSGAPRASSLRCGRCTNCRIFSWSHLEATLWLFGHVVSIGTLYYWCVVPFFEEKQLYVYGQSLVFPGTREDLFSARLAEPFFALLHPLHLLLRELYSLLTVPFQCIAAVLPFSLFVYPPEAPLKLRPVFDSSVRTSESGRAPYLLDNSDVQFRELRNAFPSLVALMCVHGLISFLLRKFAFRYFCRSFLKLRRGERPGFFFRVCTGSVASSRNSGSCDPWSLSCATGLEDLLHPKSSSVARKAWIATQHVHVVFELSLGLCLATYLHSVHVIILILYALLNYTFTLLLPAHEAASSLSTRGSSPSNGAQDTVSGSTGKTGLRRRIDAYRCPLVIALTVTLHLGMLVVHGLTPHFSLVYIHPGLLPVETFCFAFLRPRYSLHDCMRMIALKMLAFNLDKVWAFQLRKKSRETLSELGASPDSEGAVHAERRPTNTAVEEEMTTASSPSTRAKDKAASHSSVCASDGHEMRNSRMICSQVEREVLHPKLCPNPFEDERFFPRDSLSVPTSTYASVLRYLAYTFYAPTYLAGPHFAYNSWNRQTAFPWWVLLGHNEHIAPSTASREREPTAVPLRTRNARGMEETEECRAGESSRAACEQEDLAELTQVPSGGAALLRECAARALGLPRSDLFCRSPTFAFTRPVGDAGREASSGDETDLELRHRSRRLRASRVSSKEGGEESHKEDARDELSVPVSGVAARRGRSHAGRGETHDPGDSTPFGLHASPFLLDMPCAVYLKLFLKHVFPYFLGWLLVLLVLEVHMRYLPVNALVTQLRNIPLWNTMQIRQLFTMSATVLCFMWLKFVCLWRFFRLWSMVAGAVPPENMVRFLYNNYSTEQFWRGWHRSFNLYLIRYMYVPMIKMFDLAVATLRSSQSAKAAASVSSTERQEPQEEATPLLVEQKVVPAWQKLLSRSIATFLIFLYVAMWHDFNANVFYWGLGCACGLVPEAIIRYWAFGSPAAKRIARGEDASSAAAGKEEESESLARGRRGEGQDANRRGGKGADEAYIAAARSDVREATGNSIAASRGPSEDVCPDEGLDGMDRQKRRASPSHRRQHRDSENEGGVKNASKNKRRQQRSHEHDDASDSLMPADRSRGQCDEEDVQRKGTREARKTFGFCRLFSPLCRAPKSCTNCLDSGGDVRGRKSFKVICGLAGTVNVLLLGTCNLVGYSYGI
ncbi:putative MBOAT domain, related protein [Toxoplasma gondii CAST]|uniref:Putative MBOAT domain, related protein n=1 Tax=Toxoplasma gondii CAST TaxID=943122 RepID=A0A425HLI3_TOXGO|nr:putative MBOAT domain, related protein [Toxoplasma gondii CAST]